MLLHISNRHDDLTAYGDTTVSLEKLQSKNSLVLEGLKFGKVETAIFLEPLLPDPTYPNASITVA
jgi:hypothetical protein